MLRHEIQHRSCQYRPRALQRSICETMMYEALIHPVWNEDSIVVLDILDSAPCADEVL